MTRRTLIRVAVIVFAPIIIGAGLLWYGLTSEGAAKALIAKGLARTGDMVKIGTIRGSLRGPLILGEVTVRTDAYAAEIDSIFLTWRPTGLVHRQVRIDRLHVTGVRLVLPDSVPRDTAPKRPELPMDVLFGDVRVDRISVIAPNGVKLEGGAVQLAGRAEDYRIVARGIITAPNVDRAPVAISGTGDLEHLQLERALTTLLDGRIAARGELAWWPKIRWNLAVHADSIRPAMMLAEPAAWPGRVSAWAGTEGVMDSIGPLGRANVDSVGGALRGHRLAGTLSIRFTGPRYEIPELALDWGSAHVVASGTVAEDVAIAYRAIIGSIGMLVPGARGSLVSVGRVSGPRATPRVRASIQGRGFAQGTNRLARLTGRADVDLAPGGRTHVDLRGSDAQLGRQLVDEIVMALRGTQRNHRLTADATSPDGDLTLAATGRLNGRHWTGRIATLDVETDRAGVWQIEAPAAVSAAMRPAGVTASLGQLCLAAADPAGARICGAGSWNGPGAWRVTSTIERLPLALIDSLVPDSLLAPQQSLSGTLGIELEASSARHMMTGTMRVHADSAAVGYMVRGDSVPRAILLDTALAEGRIGRDGLHGTLSLAFLNVSNAGADTAPVGRLTGRIDLPRYTGPGLPLEGQPLDAALTGESDSLGFLTGFVRGVDSMAGSVSLDLKATGTATAPQLQGTLDFDSLSAWLRRGRSAHGSVSVTLSGTVARDRTMNGELRAVPRGVIYNYRLDAIPRRTVVDSGGLLVRAGSAGVEGIFTLGLSDTTGGRIASASARLALPEYRRFGDSLATQPLTFKLDGEMPDLAVARSMTPRFDTLSGRITLTASGEGTVAAPRLTGALRVENVRAHSTTGSVTTGGLTADLTASIAQDSALTAELRVVPQSVVLSYVENGVAKPIVLDDTTRLEVRAGADGVRGVLALSFSNESRATLGAVNGRFALPQYTRISMPLDSTPLEATFQGGMPDLSFAEAFSPEVDSLAGRLDLDARLAGTAGSPSLSGGLRIENATIRIPLIGALYREIQLSALGSPDGDVAIQGRMRAGAGEVTLEGRTPLRPTARRTGNIRIRGQSFEVANSAQVHAVISPALEVALLADTIAITGEVQVPLARIELSEIPVFAVPPSDDVVFIEDSALIASARAIRADVQIVLGDSVSFKGFNFNAELGGALQLRERPGVPTTGSGAVIIEEGHFKAYGQDLTINNGRVRFAGGPVDNPALDIRATRTADDGTVAGLQIAGTLKSPRVTIFAEPPMSQNRALHYIVMGRPPGEGTGADGNLLSKAASSLGLRGGNLLANSVGQGLGFSDAGIQSEGDLQQASFVAGRYLSPSLYVSYGIGLFDPISTLRLRYLLSERWTLQAEAGAGTGADILYKIERGN